LLNFRADEVAQYVASKEPSDLEEKKDIHGAEIYFKDIPDTHYSKLAKFLESNDRKDMAFEITPDQDHKFDLAIHLNKTDAAFEIAEAQ